MLVCSLFSATFTGGKGGEEGFREEILVSDGFYDAGPSKVNEKNYQIRIHLARSTPRYTTAKFPVMRFKFKKKARNHYGPNSTMLPEIKENPRVRISKLQ